ncbi:MAG: hypothetical protein LBR54_01935, partial [Oscillospiraceae bacterium]|nr:hypothetical protein [Oscillospiraceae bacterium]
EDEGWILIYSNGEAIDCEVDGSGTQTRKERYTGSSGKFMLESSSSIVWLNDKAKEMIYFNRADETVEETAAVKKYGGSYYGLNEAGGATLNIIQTGTKLSFKIHWIVGDTTGHDWFMDGMIEVQNGNDAAFYSNAVRSEYSFGDMGEIREIVYTNGSGVFRLTEKHIIWESTTDGFTAQFNKF